MSARTDRSLSPFILAPKEAIAASLAELQRGRKVTHWMWFVFPQLEGLTPNPSPTSQRYALRDRVHAEAFLDDADLGPRLRARTEAVLQHSTMTAEDIFGYPDWLKFRSCMTLFATIDGPDSCFQRALEVFFDGVPDDRTLVLLNPAGR